MFRHRVRRAVQTSALAMSLILVCAVLTFAEDAPPQPRPFDFYVLALSWSPSYCAAVRERTDIPEAGGAQCSDKPYAFVVHGLWPQYSQGFPSYCRQPAPRLDRALVNDMLDLMPSRSLIYREWSRHGTCSGLGAQRYFDTLRKARSAVTIPPAFRAPSESRDVAPAEVAAAFVAVNPGLPPDGVAVACDKTRLTGVRLCMSKELSFQSCPAVARRSCKRTKLVMPAVGGGAPDKRAGLDSAIALSAH